MTVGEHDLEKWDPRAYWTEYYGGDDLPSDERAMFAFCVGAMAADGRRFERLLDFGSGPTVHRLAPFAPHVGEIHVADFDPRNLAQVTTWLEAGAGALPWDKFFALTLELEGSEPTAAAVGERKELLRELVSTARHCDARLPEPLGAPARFDLLSTFFCLDCITTSRARWREYMCHLLALVGPAGRVVLTALGESGSYPVGNDTFPSANLTAEDLADALTANGFDPATVRIERAALPDEERRPYASLGYVLMATARRP